jgi:hypothetical protein
VTVGGENLVSKTSQLRHTFSQTWQERRSSGKRGKSDVNVARPTLTWQLRHTSSQTWQERRSSGKRGKRDVPVENVARATLTWQDRR